MINQINLNQIQSQQMSGKLVKQIKERIKEEGTIEQIVELNLEELRIPSISNDIKKILQKAKNLEILLLGDNDLQNVDNLPKLQLTVLDLSANKINESALKRISQFSQLGQLILAGNDIKTLQSLKPLFKLSKLAYLDLSENPVSELEGYRELIFKQMPSLQALDHADKNGEPIPQESEQLEQGSDQDGSFQDSEDEDEDQSQDNEK